jgi:L-iditol 2-dehydrogenase
MKAAYVKVPFQVDVREVPAPVSPPLRGAHAGADGVVVFNGIDFSNPSISFDANEFHFKRLQLKATHSIPNLRFPIAIDLLKRKAADPDLFITHRFGFGELSRALETAERDKEGAVKVMVTMEG